jgi:hypothetical protein
VHQSPQLKLTLYPAKFLVSKLTGRLSDQLRQLKDFMEATKDFKSAAYSLGVAVGFEGWVLVLVIWGVVLPLPQLASSSFAGVSVVLDAAAFLGLPRPFKLPRPLGNKSLKILVELIWSKGLTGEAGIELLNWEVITGDGEEEEEEEESFKVSFSFLGAKIAGESLSVI